MLYHEIIKYIQIDNNNNGVVWYTSYFDYIYVTNAAVVYRHTDI